MSREKGLTVNRLAILQKMVAAAERRERAVKRFRIHPDPLQEAGNECLIKGIDGMYHLRKILHHPLVFLMQEIKQLLPVNHLFVPDMEPGRDSLGYSVFKLAIARFRYGRGEFHAGNGATDVHPDMIRIDVGAQGSRKTDGDPFSGMNDRHDPYLSILKSRMVKY